MDLLIKRTLSLSIKLSEEFSGLFSTDNDTLQDVYTKHYFQCLQNVHRRSSERGFQTIKTRVAQ